MTNNRIFRIDTVTSGSSILAMNNHGSNGIAIGYDATGSIKRVGPIEYNATGSTGKVLNSVWGVLLPIGVVTSGSLYLEGGGALSLQTLITGQIYPAYPIGIQVSAGSALLLS
jgi:hypothetical protein